ncbi:MAG: hypothetical protein PCFJNLEI_01749 [Verrucomicrobiae bacterium]|nr:hypothetical protein [Verrucomicrobiae bacterium]
MNWIELIGYVGSALIAVSMMMGNIWRLRWLNLIGGVVFTTYGVLLHSVPVALLNGFIVAINIYHLIQLTRQQDYFTLAELHPQSVFRDKFLEFYRADIERYYPGFAWEKLANPQSVFVLRNLMPVKLLAYEVQADGTVLIQMDYVIPSYRDLKNAGFVFSQLRETWLKQGGQTLVTRSVLKSHQRYLQAVGFRADAADPTLFRRPV